MDSIAGPLSDVVLLQLVVSLPNSEKNVRGSIEYSFMLENICKEAGDAGKLCA
jgi:hypothetical protein